MVWIKEEILLVQTCFISLCELGAECVIHTFMCTCTSGTCLVIMLPAVLCTAFESQSFHCFYTTEMYTYTHTHTHTHVHCCFMHRANFIKACTRSVFLCACYFLLGKFLLFKVIITFVVFVLPVINYSGCLIAYLFPDIFNLVSIYHAVFIN